MSYNKIFEEFHDRDEDQVRGLIAYGLYKIAKREWVEQKTATGRRPTPAEIEAYHQTWTPANIAGKRAQADQVLIDYSSEVIAQERPKIVEEALRGTFWKTVVVNIVSAFLYTLILIGIVVVLRWAGIDVLAIANAT